MIGRKTTKPRVRRSAKRYRVEEITSALGEVLDLSARGMRVRVESRPTIDIGRIETFSICAHGRTVWVEGRIAWRRRMTLWPATYEMGVEFIDDRPGLEELMGALARFGAFPDPQDAHDASTSAARTRRRPSGATASIVDLYAVMGVAPGATDEQIHDAYRTLARRLHPDANPDEGAGERFADVARAYAVLRDPEARARYDAMRSAPRAA